MFFPIMIFAISGFEHCIANMAFVPAGLLCGADTHVDYRNWLYQNLLLAILGNIVGGGFAMGGTAFYIFNWTGFQQHVQGEQTAVIPIEEQEVSSLSMSQLTMSSAISAATTGRGVAIATVQQHHDELEPLDMERVCTAFAAFDSDNDGRLSAQQALCALEAVQLGYPMDLLVGMMRSQAIGDDADHVDLAGLERLARRVRELRRLGLTGDN